MTTTDDFITLSIGEYSLLHSSTDYMKLIVYNHSAFPVKIITVKEMISKKDLTSQKGEKIDSAKYFEYIIDKAIDEHFHISLCYKIAEKNYLLEMSF